MLHLFHGRDKAHHKAEMDEIFRLRARMFNDRLGWTVKVIDGREVDEYDDLDPLYLCSLERDRVVGCLRLLPTTGPTLLSGPLASMFEESVDIRSPSILEGTRFAVSEAAERIGRTGVSRATVELLMGACEIMLEAGMSYMMGVVEDSTWRVCRLTGWTPSIIARSTRPAGNLAVLWEISDAALSRMCRRYGFRPEYRDNITPLRKTG